MIEIRTPEYDDKEYDSCGNTTMAILEISSITIPLCEECLNDLYNSINDYKSKIRCIHCNHWYCSKYGPKYGGTCEINLLKYRNKHIEDISKDEYGDIECTSFYHTCENAEPNIDTEKTNMSRTLNIIHMTNELLHKA